MSVIKQRYAEALLAASRSPEEANFIGNALLDFSLSCKENTEIRDFFYNPTIKQAIKKETILKIFNKEEDKLVVNFLFLLLDKRRFSFLTEIADEYTKCKNERQKNLEINVFSAMPLDEEQTNKIIEKYKKQYGATTAYVNLKIDPSVIGGVQIQIGDIRINDTQSGRLQALRQFISGNE